MNHVIILYCVTLSFTVRSFVHHSIRLFTWNRYHFWVLPNLSEDVGFTASFWPIYTLERTSNTISKTIGTGSSQSLSEKDLAVTRTESQFEDVPLDTTDSETKSDDELSINHSESEHTSSNKSTDSNEQVNAEKRNGKTCSSSSDYSLSSSISSCSSQCSSNQATTKNDSFERLLRKSHSTPDYRIGFGSVCTKPPATIEAHSLTFDRRMAITKSLTIPANVLRECKQLLRSKIEPKRTVKVDKPALETSSDEFEILNETDVLKEIRN